MERNWNKLHKKFKLFFLIISKNYCEQSEKLFYNMYTCLTSVLIILNEDFLKSLNEIFYL